MSQFSSEPTEGTQLSGNPRTPIVRDASPESPQAGAEGLPRPILLAAEDRLHMFAHDFDIEYEDVVAELRRTIELDPGVSTYSEWMRLCASVETSFAAAARAGAFRRLVSRAREEFDVDDPYVLEFVLASLSTIGMPGDPVWGFVVGPPSAMKTEFLRWLNGLPQVYTLSRLTPHSLISGLKGGHSLMPDLDGKVLVIKDFTTVLEMDRKAREEVLSQLRDAFDGYYEGHYGSVGKLSFAAHFHVLAAVTSAIEEYYSVQSFLGPRFLKVRVPHLDGFERCLAQGGQEDTIRKEFSHLLRRFVDRVSPNDWMTISIPRVSELRPIVEFLARGRTHVSRFNGEISLAPEPEMLPRLTKQFRKLAVGRAIVYGRSEVDDSDLAFLRRVAFDTLPQNRSQVLRALYAPSTADQVTSVVRLSRATVYRTLEELEALDLVSGGGSPVVYHLIGPAAALVPPHTRETGASPVRLTGVGGDLADAPGEPGSWTEPPVGPPGAS